MIIINLLFQGIDAEEDFISKATHKAIDSFTAKYAPEGYIPEDNFLSAFWMLVNEIQLQAFEAGFNIAMDLRNTNKKRALNKNAATQTV